MNENEMKPSPRSSFLLRVTKQISQTRLMVAQGYPLAALLRVLGRVLDLVRGKLSAFIVGWPKSYLGCGSKVIGTRAIVVTEKIFIGRYAWIEAVSNHCGQTYRPVIKIGREFYAAERLHISANNRVEIGDNCLFGSCIYVSDHNHGSYNGGEQSNPNEPPVQRKLSSQGPVIIGSNVWIGDNVVVVGPVRIGSGSVIGANSVVTRDIPGNVIAVGVPAKIIKQFVQESGRWEKFPENFNQHEIQ